jgi:hypothetical protein
LHLCSVFDFAVGQQSPAGARACIHGVRVRITLSLSLSLLLRGVQVAVAAGADSDKYPPGWLFHQKWSAGKQKGPAPTLDGHRIEVIKVAGRVRSGHRDRLPATRKNNLSSSSLCHEVFLCPWSLEKARTHARYA